ncbi:MAG TPA: septum formation family protein [Mycobacterium sp.]|nr:septum formation family protein [Mycobacterium sp.]
MTQRWPDEAKTEAMPVHESHKHAAQRRAGPPMWLTKVLFIGVAVAVVVASVVVALQMTNRSTGTAPAADAQRGNCLTWPPGAPERATQVDCAGDHLFEVAGSDAKSEDCARVVTDYLGTRYDANGRFVVGTLQTGGGLLCGLQLPSAGAASVPFKGKVVDQDQSRIWATGTCLGIRDGKTTDIAVDCGLPHALEITGTVDLSAAFTQAAPSIAAQDAMVNDVCGAATSAYLAPITLAATGLAVRYSPIDAAGWAAGSRRVACSIGSPEPDHRWATLVRSAKNGVRVTGQVPGALPSPAPVPLPAPSPATPEPAPVEASAPVSEAPEPSATAEVPVRASRETDETTDETTNQTSDASQSVPHMDGAEAPGPIPHMAGPELPGPVPHMAGSAVPGSAPHMAGTGAPGPGVESTPVAPLPDSASTP